MDNTPIKIIDFQGSFEEAKKIAAEWFLARVKAGFQVQIKNSCQFIAYGPSGHRRVITVFYTEEKQEPPTHS